MAAATVAYAAKQGEQERCGPAIETEDRMSGAAIYSARDGLSDGGLRTRAGDGLPAPLEERACQAERGSAA